MRTITLQATEHDDARQAFEHARGAGDHDAILLGGRYLTAAKAEVEKLAEARVEFAYLAFHRPTGRVLTIPVTDR